MSFRSIMSLVLAVILTACASVKPLPDGGFLINTTVSDSIDRSTTVSGEYDCPVDDKGQPKIGQCKLKDPKAKDRTTGATVAGQAVVGAVGGTGAALIGARTARSVAEIMSCKKNGGKDCGDEVTNVNVNNNLTLPSCGGAACGTATP